MANQEHLAILKQGAGVWNEWRKQHPEAEPDLSEIHFGQLGLPKCSYFDEKYIDLEGIDFSATNLRNARIWETDLTRADLSWANLNSTDLWASLMPRANITYN